MLDQWSTNQSKRWLNGSSIKGVSSRNLRQEFTGRVNRFIMHGRFWSGSYFAGSCGGAPPAIVKQYIEQQKRPLQPASTANPRHPGRTVAAGHRGDQRRRA
ncbi:transposase [Streptomyces sp. ME18-1-4]|uniref:transposase n=1 Tax=Streptomyces sp. ME18-1-4 TaxID=3028685 RepID=UPI0029A844A9|nr:transposase [Streptomyces sp. ME18-1-4]MDX3245685.1 transposase [Streptomyces sp. ME18-1-4]